MIHPYSTDLCGFYYVSIFNDFPCICCHMWSWEFPKSKYIKVELDPWILGAANNFFLQPKLHLGWKGMKWSSNPCTVLQLEEISLARLQRVGVMKFSNTSLCGWTQLCLSQLLWNDWKIKTRFVFVQGSETVQIWKEKPSCKELTQCAWLGLQSRRLLVIKGVANISLQIISRDLSLPDHVLVRLDLSRLSVIYVKFCNSFYRRIEMNNYRLLRIWPLKSAEMLIGWLGPITKQVCLTRQWD